MYAQSIIGDIEIGKNGEVWRGGPVIVGQAPRVAARCRINSFRVW